MDEPKKRKSRNNPEQPKKRGRPAYTPEQRAEADKRNAEAREKRRQQYAENPDMYKKKEWSMGKPESLRGGAIQDLDRYCNAKNEEISQYVADVTKWYRLGRTKRPITDEECEARIIAFLEYCEKKGEIPTPEKMALALGVGIREVERWRNGERGSVSRQEMIELAYQCLAASDAELAIHNKIPQILYIFRSKNFHRMRDQTDVVHYSETRKAIDEAELRKRIMESVIIDVDEDGNVI